MKKYFKHILSIGVISVFWIIACATISQPINRNIEAKDCDFFNPAKFKTQEVVFRVFDTETKLPIINANGKSVFYYYSKHMEDTICILKLDKTLNSFQLTDEYGIIENFKFNSYFSSEDYLRVDVTVEKEGYYYEFENRTLFYDQDQLIVTLYLLKRNTQP